MLTSRVICDSISDSGIRLTTLQLRYPRMVHADFMTHRVFSRNGRSSRAVPFATLVKETPYVPHFLKNQPGMVAGGELEQEQFEEAQRIWLYAAEVCQQSAGYLNDLGVHKQWINRMLEWFGFIDVLVTSTEWANFLELRLDSGAQPEIIDLARAIKASIDGSTPARCVPGAWHLPYVDAVMEGQVAYDYLDRTNPGWDRNLSLEQAGNEIYDVLKKVSVARCARLTIRPFDGDGSIDKEMSRYEKLMVSRPVHASPAEHIATPDTKMGKTVSGWLDNNPHKPTYKETWHNEQQHGNFYGWRQFRKMIPHNTIYDR